MGFHSQPGYSGNLCSSGASWVVTSSSARGVVGSCEPVVSSVGGLCEPDRDGITDESSRPPLVNAMAPAIAANARRRAAPPTRSSVLDPPDEVEVTCMSRVFWEIGSSSVPSLRVMEPSDPESGVNWMTTDLASPGCRVRSCPSSHRSQSSGASVNILSDNATLPVLRTSSCMVVTKSSLASLKFARVHSTSLTVSTSSVDLAPGLDAVPGQHEGDSWL